MSRNTSPRLKLVSESDDELIDQFEYNWPQLDKYAHPVGVSAGGTLPDAELYDGCILAEPPSVSSKLWMARKNNVDAYVKNYITYPWSIALASKTYNQAGTVTAQGWEGGFISGLNSTDNVNSSAADVEPVTWKIIVPETGIYSCSMCSIVVSNGDRTVVTLWNHEGGDLNTSETIARVGGNVGSTTFKSWNCREFFLRKGVKLAFTMTIYGGGTIFANRAWVTLINTINEDV